MGSRGFRTTLGVVAVVAATLFAALVTGTFVPAPVAAAGGTSRVAGPPSPGWTCTPDVASSRRVPVLLVPGTGLTARENWSATAARLAGRGHAVCTVDLPRWGTGDLRASTRVVARALAGATRAAGRPVAVVGHSQGAYLARAALRRRPALAGRVSDVVGLAGVYDRGSRRLAERCRTAPCATALRQLAHGSAVLRSLARTPLPGGPSYTAVGSLGDLAVTPQPAANRQPGTTSVLLQDVCPGRTLEGQDHALLVGDAVTAALLDDALDHPGPADPARLPASVCERGWAPGFDPEAFLALAGRIGVRLRS